MRAPRNNLPSMRRAGRAGEGPAAWAARLTGACLCACAVWGCAHVARETDMPAPRFPAAYSRAGTNAAPARWWLAFGDADLAQLVETALTNSPTLSQAWARLRQAEALAVQAGAERVPEFNLEGLASRSRTVSGFGTDTANRFELGLAAAYELDLWGRVAATRRAALLDRTASRGDLAAAAQTLAAQVAERWYAWRAAGEQIRLVQDQIRAGRENLELIELRFRSGQNTVLEVLQQREQVAALETILPDLEAAAQTARHQLAVLLGQVAGRGGLPRGAGGLPTPPPLPAPGVPADLVLMRPDVRAAEARLRAADERAAAAVVNRLPSLRLSASAGTAAGTAEALWEEETWSLAAGLLGPVIDGGRRRAEAERARAIVVERRAAFRQALLTAFREVEDALVTEAAQADTLARQQERLHAAALTYTQSLERYRRGLNDYLTVLIALNRKQATEREMVAVRQRILAARIQLHRALGGTWTDALPPPDREKEKPQERSVWNEDT